MCNHNCAACGNCAELPKVNYSSMLEYTRMYFPIDIYEDQNQSKTEIGKRDIRTHNSKVDIINNAIAALDYDTLISHVTITNHSDNGKMAGKISISTSVAINPFCRTRRALNPDQYVCPHCFANAISNARPNARRSCKRNSLILTSVIIPVEYWKKLKLTKKQKHKALSGIRIESLGDTANIIHAINYINLCLAFPEYSFTVWSKNWFIWNKAYTENGKPENMIYIHSSIRLNKIDNPPKDFYNQYTDYDFTVYTKEYALEHPENNYNCCTPYENGRQCIRDCNECYSKGNGKHRREMLR